MDIFYKLKCMAQQAFSDAKTAYEYALSEQNTSQHQFAPFYLNKAVSQMCAVEVLYLARFDSLENSAVEDVIHQFNVFANELLQCYATNHSHQWTITEFKDYEESYNNSPFAPES